MAAQVCDGFNRRIRYSERRVHILRLAGDLFLAHGFDRVSIDMIIRSVGGSKRDLYAIFSDKDELFKEVIVHLCHERLLPLQTISLDTGLVESLRLCAATVIEIVLSPVTLAVHRLFVAEADRLGDNARLFLMNGPHRACALVAAVIDRHVASGSLRTCDAPAVATLFIDSVIGDFQLRALLGAQISRNEIEAKIVAAVDFFLDGYKGKLRPRFPQ